MAQSAAVREWVAMWPLPLVAMFGVAGAGMFSFSSGVFLTIMTEEFGWSRTEFSSIFTVQMVLGLGLMPLAGRLVDRVGPRLVGLAGIAALAIAFSALSFANGDLWQWWLFGVLQAVAVALIAPPVWISAVVPFFRASRGLAIAVGLAGVGLATASWPAIAVFLIGHLGWRSAFPAMAIAWAALMLPLALRFVARRSAVVSAIQAGPAKPSLPYFAALRSPIFLAVTLAGAIFAAVSFGMSVNLVPILQDRGVSLAGAAGLAGVLGVCSISGRVATGYLLDRLPTLPLAICVFLLPVLVCLLLLAGHGSYALATLAVALLGFAAGAETDVVVFTLSRCFPGDLFASIYSVATTVFSIFTTLGLVMASFFFDLCGNYVLYLEVALPMIVAASALIGMALSSKVAKKKLRAAGIPSPDVAQP